MKNVYPVFTLNGKIIDESDTVRYLGHILGNVFYECENPIVQYLLFTHVYCATVVESHSR